MIVKKNAKANSFQHKDRIKPSELKAHGSHAVTKRQPTGRGNKVQVKKSPDFDHTFLKFILLWRDGSERSRNDVNETISALFERMLDEMKKDGTLSRYPSRKSETIRELGYSVEGR
jgi:hypothetical protein